MLSNDTQKVFPTHLSVTFIHNPRDLNLFSPHSPRFSSLSRSWNYVFFPSFSFSFLLPPNKSPSSALAQLSSQIPAFVPAEEQHKFSTPITASQFQKNSHILIIKKQTTTWQEAYQMNENKCLLKVHGMSHAGAHKVGIVCFYNDNNLISNLTVI